jgi:hypothetical protein
VELARETEGDECAGEDDDVSTSTLRRMCGFTGAGSASGAGVVSLTSSADELELALDDVVAADSDGTDAVGAIVVVDTITVALWPLTSLSPRGVV